MNIEQNLRATPPIAADGRKISLLGAAEDDGDEGEDLPKRGAIIDIFNQKLAALYRKGIKFTASDITVIDVKVRAEYLRRAVENGRVEVQKGMKETGGRPAKFYKVVKL